MEKITSYLRETKIELDNVVWPKLPMTFIHTAIVIIISFAVGYFSGFFDLMFKKGLALILGI